MTIQEFVELNTFSTFMVQATARYFTVLTSVEDIDELLQSDIWKNNKRYILGEGSNTLFAGNYDGIVVRNQIQGLELVREDNETMTVTVGAGENWHQFVVWSLDQGLWGVENLALIPGTIGASPVQNIGAYGVEVQQVIHSVHTISVVSGKRKIFDNKECDFSYRNSFFKQHEGAYIITHVTFVLQKKSSPVLTYGRIKEELPDKDISNLTPQDIATAVIAIRDSKLPRVGDVGTAGSFFKNPVVSSSQAKELKIKFPEMIQFQLDNGEVKISAAWLIEHLGYKGVQEDSVGTYEKHALVLVNHGGASGTDVWGFAQKIITRVKETFNINLEAEVRVIS